MEPQYAVVRWVCRCAGHAAAKICERRPTSSLCEKQSKDTGKTYITVQPQTQLHQRRQLPQAQLRRRQQQPQAQLRQRQQQPHIV